MIPAYNEARHIGEVVHDVLPFVERVIVTDDGSSDGTDEIARKNGALVLRHFNNCGAGAATMTGLVGARELGFDVAITIDADGQHNPADIPKLLDAMKKYDADLVLSNRFGEKNSIPFIRRIFNAIGNLVTFTATGMFVSDSQSGFKAFGPKALQQVDLRMSGFEFCTEIIREAVQNGWHVVSVPTKVTYSEYTMAKGQSFAGGVRTAARILLRSFMR